ncbi:MAG: protein phosphatase 2C domain-containing protein [Sporichthyaceae bacterium]
MTMSLRYAARSNVGLIREGNEDSGYAGPSLLAVADGMGGHAAGEVASAVAVSTLATLEDDVPSTELLDALAASVQAANDAISDMVEKQPQLDGMGTTLTALLWAGKRIGLVHIGDSRAYLLRAGELTQITHDHTFVQQLQDEGRITAAEAGIHPQRSLLLRALDGRSNPEPDLSIREAQLGDRYLVCSDGLSGVVSDAELALAMTDTTVEFAADTLIQLALDGGAPDNVTAIVADVVEVDANPSEHPVVVGAAGGKHKAAVPGQTSEIDLSTLPPAGKEARRIGGLWVRTLILAIVLAVGATGWAGYAWSQRQYYVGADADQVAIFKGLPQKVIGKSLSETFERQDIALTDLPSFDRDEVRDTIFTGSIDKARKVVDRLRSLAINCQDSRAAAAEALALALGEDAVDDEVEVESGDPRAEGRRGSTTASPEPDAGVTSGAPTPSPATSRSPDPSASPTTPATASPAEAILDGADVIAACGPPQ